ncbi:MAG: hypothetical protein FWE82_08750 [Defluviitaleaceae bacterium]|nr:hypothetical protein [Defluviitaleaceae bacterium]
MKFFKLSLSYGIPFGMGMGVLWGLQYGIWYGLIGGTCAGLLFGTLMAFVTLKRQKRLQNTKNSYVPDCEIIFESYANLINGFFPIEGHLFLTKESLVFVFAREKASNKTLKYSLTDIQDVKPCKHRLNSNALIIVCNEVETKFLFDSGHARGFEYLAAINTSWVENILLAVNAAKFSTDGSVTAE